MPYIKFCQKNNVSYINQISKKKNHVYQISNNLNTYQKNTIEISSIAQQQQKKKKMNDSINFIFFLKELTTLGPSF